jgi:hypothetical protein
MDFLKQVRFCSLACLPPARLQPCVFVHLQVALRLADLLEGPASNAIQDEALFEEILNINDGVRVSQVSGSTYDA